MNHILKKNKLASKRHKRVRKKVTGTASRPRLSLKLSNKHMYAQCIDDEKQHTLVFLSSLSKENRTILTSCNIENVKKFADIFGQKAKAEGFVDVVFDRGDRRFHGTVKTFADTVRNYLKF